MALDPLNVKHRAGQLNLVRRHLLPLPIVDRPRQVDTDVFGPLESRPAPGLKGKRIGVVGSAGGGECVALVGVKRAFEEAGIEAEAVSACSGSAIWGAMWAAGMSAQEMADFSLSWRPQDYLGMQWTRLPQLVLGALRGFDGLASGEALEHLFDRRLWHMEAGEADVSFHTAVYALERGELEYFGSTETPELTLGELVRIAVARPSASEAVRVEGELYVDGAPVDAFPAEPLIAEGGFDHVFGLNVALPEGLEGGSAALDEVQRLELARRSARVLGESLTLIEPITRGDARDFAFHDPFSDRGGWPSLMRRGYETTIGALAPFRSSARRGRRS